MDKLTDVSKAISDKQHAGLVQGGAGAGGGPTGKRAKSPFSIFKRPKSREPSPMRAQDLQGGGTLPVHITVSSLRVCFICCYYNY